MDQARLSMEPALRPTVSVLLLCDSIDLNADIEFRYFWSLNRCGCGIAAGDYYSLLLIFEQTVAFISEMLERNIESVSSKFTTLIDLSDPVNT